MSICCISGARTSPVFSRCSCDTVHWTQWRTWKTWWCTCSFTWDSHTFELYCADRTSAQYWSELASSPGHSQILSCGCPPSFLPQLWDKIWGCPWNEARSEQPLGTGTSTAPHSTACARLDACYTNPLSDSLYLQVCKINSAPIPHIIPPLLCTLVSKWDI